MKGGSCHNSVGEGWSCSKAFCMGGEICLGTMSANTNFNKDNNNINNILYWFEMNEIWIICGIIFGACCRETLTADYWNERSHFAIICFFLNSENPAGVEESCSGHSVEGFLCGRLCLSPGDYVCQSAFVKSNTNNILYWFEIKGSILLLFGRFLSGAFL